MPVRGDFAKLERALRKVARIAAGETARSTRNLLAEESVTQVQLGFREQRDPYGSPWAPLKHRKGRILQDTGRLRASFHVEPHGNNGFRLFSNVGYGAVHQYGANWTAKGRVNFHNRKGRFVSRTKAEAKARKRKRGAVKISVTGAHDITVPARPMVPVGGNLGSIWRAAFMKILKRQMRAGIAK